MRALRRQLCSASGLVVIGSCLLIIAASYSNGDDPGEMETDSITASLVADSLDNQPLTEENALKAYFKGKQLLGAAYFAKNAALTKHYSTEAERCIERSLTFYIPDIKAMTRGEPSVHATATWEFIKGAHETWRDAMELSRGRMGIKERVEANIKDAWAFLILSQMVGQKHEKSECCALTDDKFQSVRRRLDEDVTPAKQMPVLKHSEHNLCQQLPSSTCTRDKSTLSPYGPPFQPTVSAESRNKAISAKPIEGELLVADPVSLEVFCGIKAAATREIHCH